LNNIYKFGISLWLIAFSSISNAELLFGRVVGIADGDTITLLDSSKVQHRIRLSGIDAPEKAQPYGQVSKKSLSDLVYDKTIQVEYSRYDRYGRLIGKIVSSGLDVNLEQIKKGLAWHYKKYQYEQSVHDQKIYAAAEIEAQLNKSGLWQDPDPIEPWDWRRKKFKK
jgi:endonuclease YncB( thermonuclease family)